jgi:dipeptidyl aminopeptidase/acylaminoacyl peptidase
MRRSRFLAATTWAALLLATGVFAQTPAPPAIEVFTRVPAFSQPALSPDGRRLAVLALGQSGRKQLAVIDAQNVAQGKVVAAFNDADIGAFQWISDRRLVFRAVDLTSGGGNQLAPGLYAVDADGSEYRALVDREWRGTAGRRIGDRALPWYTFLLAPSAARNSDVVYVVQAEPRRLGFEPSASALLKLDTRTGESTNLSLGAPTGAGSWLVDEDGQPRARVVLRDGKLVVHYRDPKDGTWRVIAEFALVGGEGFLPLQARRDGTLLVVANHGRDTRALWQYDPAARRVIEPPLVSVEGFDFDGQLVWDGVNERLLGVHVIGDAPGTVWLDDKMKQAQARVDALLPGTVNRLSVPLRPAAPLLLVESSSDAQPPVYALYNTETQALTRFARAMPDIDARALGRMDFVRYKARDGRTVPMYYTLPPAHYGKSRLPTVALIHGGPWVRGSRWGWDSQAQLLASRGYLVLEPEFRGSDGYGYAHLKAGFGQWGAAMQDDVTDAVQWAIAQGLADPQRVCAAGASYGGYATLMALAKEPQLFKCGVAWVAVTDIELMFTASWTDVTESGRRYGYGVMIGDPKADAEKLHAASPTANAARITQPLLLAYGAQDLRVPLEHGRKFRALVTQHNKDVEWIVYGDEGHGWLKPENKLDFWTRVEKFLAAHIGAAK